MGKKCSVRRSDGSGCTFSKLASLYLATCNAVAHPQMDGFELDRKGSTRPQVDDPQQRVELVAWLSVVMDITSLVLQSNATLYPLLRGLRRRSSGRWVQSSAKSERRAS